MATNLTTAQIQAYIDSIDAKLNQGLTSMMENGRLMKFDLSELRTRRDELIGLLPQATDAMTQSPRQIRRVLVTQFTKGL